MMVPKLYLYEMKTLNRVDYKNISQSAKFMRGFARIPALSAKKICTCDASHVKRGGLKQMFAPIDGFVRLMPIPGWQIHSQGKTAGSPPQFCAIFRVGTKIAQLFNQK
jgi:hypothetical protein